MSQSHPAMSRPNATAIERTQQQIVSNYAAELELEVDRLRGRDQFLQQEAKDHICQIVNLCSQVEQSRSEGESVRSIKRLCEVFDKLLQDLREPRDHPSFDQVIAIDLRSLAEQVFRWQQRLSGATDAVLRLDLQPNSINWFPIRMRHILDNLFSNALRYRDAGKGEIRVGLQLRVFNSHYELTFSDNGLGIPSDKLARMLELSYRAAPSRGSGLGVGLAVVKLLVEQSCGTLSVSSSEGQGTSVAIVLPRYDLDDHID